VSCELVYQDGGVFVGVGAVNRIVHAARLALAIAAHDRAAIFLGRQAFPVSFRARFSMVSVKRIPSTALILVKRARPTTKPPALAPFAADFFCFAISIL